MRCSQKAELIIMLAMFAALAVVVFMEPFYGVVTALVITLFSLLFCVMARRFDAERTQADKMTEKAVKEWATTFDSIGDLVSIQDRDFKLVRVNKAYADTFKMKPEDLVGRHCFEVVHNLKCPRKDCPHVQVMETKQYASAEIFEPHLGCYLEVSCSPVFDEKENIIGTIHLAKDITARKQAEEMLRESERNLAITFSSIGDAVIATDSQGRIVRMNRVAEQLTGWKFAEARTRPLAEVFHIINQYTRQRVENPVAKVLQAGKTHGLANDTVLVSRQGREYVIADSAATIADDKTGQTVGVVLVFRDQTKEHALAEAMRVSEENYRVIFEESANGILVADVEMRRFIYANPAICRMFGYSEDELLKMGIMDIHPKDSLKHVMAEFEAQARGEKTLAPAMPCRRKNGTVFYADINASSVIFNRQKCAVGFFVDITKRVGAEQKSAMLSDAIETAHHGCLIISEDYKVIFSNNYALAKLGFDADELNNMDLFSFCADREQVKDIIETMKLTRRWMGEIVVIKKDGEQFPALVSITALGADDDAPGRKGDVILFQDITIQKEMREKLLTSEKLAVMGRLVADVAHEINNPLSIVIGGTQLMLSRIDERAQTTFKNQLETVLRNARRCKTILSNLLGYGRTIGKKEETVNLSDLIREAIDDVNYQHDMSAIEVALNYNDLAAVEITGNRSALLSVFVNLIRNARQAMGEKGRLTITIEKEDKRHIRIEIHDTGIGMNAKQKAELFKPFTSGWKKGEGSGLGLATSLGIVATHGGSIAAESEGEGKGAKFTILLPCEFKRKKMNKGVPRITRIESDDWI